MATIQRFEDLTFWKEARDLNKLIFVTIVNNVNIKDHALKDQINRSAGSIMDNIAEGFDRQGNKEFRQMLTIARGSCGEVKSQLIRATDRQYISAEQFEKMNNHCMNISKMINGFVNYLNKSEFKGSKFKEPVEFYNNYKQTY